MKSNLVLKEILLQVGLLVVALNVFSQEINAIRIYEGTNIEEPKGKQHKRPHLNKKALYISKRSWDPVEDNVKSASKSDRRYDSKWKDFDSEKSPQDSQPTLYKIKFSEDFGQYVKYIQEVPRLEEYTMCLWYKANNLTHDHSLFSYSFSKKDKLLKFWLNAIDSSLRMSIRDNVVYKVPANIRPLKWHHICQSWHGVFGEWQVFLDGKKIGAGDLPQYKETYIPEKGEVVLGQDLPGPYGRLDGELFGFNMVDEAVPSDQAEFINSQYKPNVQGSFPPFKKLPPIKKTFQEIKAYITRLPKDPAELTKGMELKTYPDEIHNTIKRTRESHPPKRNRGSSRPRPPPMRKVVVYDREDRQLSQNRRPLQKNPIVVSKERTPPRSSARNVNATRKIKQDRNQVFDENYSIHSYKPGKDMKPHNYEIYESLEDDLAKPLSDDRFTSRQSIERKAKENFNLFTAREANKVYTLSNSVKDTKKPIFHFERSQFQSNNKKSIDLENARSVAVPTRAQVPKGTKNNKPLDSIPVYETETYSRVKRQSDEELADGFRPLPRLPDSFIDMLAKNATAFELQQQIQSFFPKNSTNEEAIVADNHSIGKAYPTSVPYVQTTPMDMVAKERKDFQSIYQIPVIGLPSPVHQLPDPSLVRQFDLPGSFLDYDPSKRLEQRNTPPQWYLKSLAERREFDVSWGTDLIMRSYGLCTTERGSPIQDKQHLVISWAETPIRIFGGAAVESAKNECGNF